MRIAVPIVLVAVALAAAAVWVMRDQPRQQQSAAPVAFQRVAWNGKVSGSPDAPPPFTVERLYPSLKFAAPVDIVYGPHNRVYVLEQRGQIHSFVNEPNAQSADLMVDLVKDVRGLDHVPDCAGIASAYGMVFHPKYDENHFVYICYVLASKVKGKELDNGTRISRFTVIDRNPATGNNIPPKIDPASEQVVITWLAGGHNGGSLQFGLDGYLYASAGDAGNPNPPDPFNAGQDMSTLLCKIIRIDVDHPSGGKNYSIPDDNPFAKLPGARGEIFAFGFRNPWRISIDRANGNVWTGDVGWELWEMAYHVRPGGNYGWSITEGPQPVHPNGKVGPTPILKPDAALPHTESASITGGYVYRGKKLPELAGHYVFGDWETRRIWSAKTQGADSGTLAPYTTIALTDLRVTTFGQDPAGELSILDYESGGIFGLVPNPDAGKSSNFPRKLSGTGLFAEVAKHTPAPGVVPFAVNAEQWNDGATAERWAAVPGMEPVTLNKDNHKVFPKDSVLLRTFTLEGKRVETQLMHFDGKRWNGYSYKWREDQSDAELVDAAGTEQDWTPAGRQSSSATRWHYPSRAQCATCHTSWTDYTNAFNEQQLNRPWPGASAGNQLADLRAAKLLPTPEGKKRKDGTIEPPPADPAPLVDPHNAKADLNTRARSYLHVNCSHCHRFGGGGSALIDLRAEAEPKQFGCVAAPARLGAFGISDARIVAPGDSARSVLLYRVAKLGSGRMPHIGSDVVDSRGVALLEQWIRGLSNPADAPPNDPAVVKERGEQELTLRALRGAESVTPSVEASLNQLLRGTSGAMTVVGAIDQGSLKPALRDRAVSMATESSNPMVADLFERYLPADKRVKRLGNSIDPAKLLALTGDLGRGRKIFFEFNGGLCRNCHQVTQEGERFGPDLSNIATKYDKAQLLDNILFPSKVIDPKYVTYTAKLSDGEDVIGLLLNRTDDEAVLLDLQRQTVRIPTKKLKELKPQLTSSMPEGMLAGLTAQQAADLLEYLSKLRQ